MPPPVDWIRCKLRSLFPSRSRAAQKPPTENQNPDRPGRVRAASPSRPAYPFTTADPLPILVIGQPAPPVLYFNEGEDPNEMQDHEQCRASTAQSPTDSDTHQTLSERPSSEATTISTTHSPSADLLQGLIDIAPDLDDRLGTIHGLGQHRFLSPTTAFSSSPSQSLQTAMAPRLVCPAATPLPHGIHYFSNARNFTVSKLTVKNNPALSKTLFEYLSPHISHGASHDSNERCDAPKCHEETRKAIRQDILSWIKHGDGMDEPERIMWLSGPAGGGKTAIAGSVAAACKDDGLLAASFFFSSFAPSADRSSKRGLIPTLAHQMSQNAALYEYKSLLLLAIEAHPDIFHKALGEQADWLILQPFRRIHDQGGIVSGPKVIIIDGLDEVIAAQHNDPTGQQAPRTSEEDQVEILNIILNLSQSPTFPFRIFVASRPECNIVDFFSTNAPGTTTELFLDSKYEPSADIKRFLESKFADIRRCAGISKAWPGEEAVDHIVDLSSGQFIVPVTVIRWVRSGLPQRQLTEVLQLERVEVGQNPFATLDALYRHIIKRAHNPHNDPRLVVKWIVSIKCALIHNPVGIDEGVLPAVFWKQFLEEEEGELSYRFAPIASLISVPPPDDTSSQITIYHKSLIDFLLSPTRCQELYVDEAALNYFLANRIFQVLKSQ